MLLRRYGQRHLYDHRCEYNVMGVTAAISINGGTSQWGPYAFNLANTAPPSEIISSVAVTSFLGGIGDKLNISLDRRLSTFRNNFSDPIQLPRSIDGRKSHTLF